MYFTDPTNVVREDLYFNHFDNALLTQTDVLADFNAGFRHEFLGGFEYDRLSHHTRRSFADFNSEPVIDLFNPVETAAPTTMFPVRRYDTALTDTKGLYFQDYMRVHERVGILVSGRYDNYNRVSQRGIATPVAIEQNPFTYRVAGNVQVLPQLSLYTSYGTSFTAQTGRDGNANPLLQLANGDEVKPETGWMYEAGARLESAPESRHAGSFGLPHSSQRHHCGPRLREHSIRAGGRSPTGRRSRFARGPARR